MCSNWLMWLWLTKSFNNKSWIAATAVLFNTHIKTNILASWWIMMMLGCITTINWWKKLTWSALGFKLGKLWEAHITELAKMPWTSIYLTSLELGVVQGDDLQSRILYALYYGPNGLKWKDFGDQQEETECPEIVVRKKEEPMDLD